VRGPRKPGKDRRGIKKARAEREETGATWREKKEESQKKRGSENREED